MEIRILQHLKVSPHKLHINYKGGKKERKVTKGNLTVKKSDTLIIK